VRVGPVGVVEVRKKLIMHNAIPGSLNIRLPGEVLPGVAQGTRACVCSVLNRRRAGGIRAMASAVSTSTITLQPRSPKTRPALLQAQRHIAYT
jgi:hypothetical protein